MRGWEESSEASHTLPHVYTGHAHIATQVIELDPKHYEAYNHRGLALMALGPDNIDKAINVCVTVRFAVHTRMLYARGTRHARVLSCVLCVCTDLRFDRFLVSDHTPNLSLITPDYMLCARLQSLKTAISLRPNAHDAYNSYGLLLRAMERVCACVLPSPWSSLFRRRFLHVPLSGRARAVQDALAHPHRAHVADDHVQTQPHAYITRT